MALIKCPECGKEISDQADRCIHCGYPLRFTKKDHTGDNPNDQMFSYNSAPNNKGAYYEQVREQRSKSGVGFWGIVGAIILSVIILSLC